MSVTSVYPVLMTADVTATAAFYREHFGFETTFEADWYVSMRRDHHELAVLDRDHETIPPAFRGDSTGGMLLNVEVDSADAEWQRLVVDGPLKAARELRSETFGQRHFIVLGPDGVLVDVIEPIEPVAEHAEGCAAATSGTTED